MTTWIIEPCDPLIVRDGRPFGPNPGARARSLPFPFPSTTTGGVRSQAGMDQNGIFDRNRIPEVKAIQVRGPVLVELDEAGEISDWLFPAPADALLLPLSEADEAKETHVQRRWLTPLEPIPDAQTDLADDLALVGLTSPDPRKPYKEPPRFWYKQQLERWLTTPQDGENIAVAELGHNGPVSEQRMHVKINPETLTGKEGALFQTNGLEFVRSLTEETSLRVKRLGLALETEAQFKAGVAPLGGERRLMRWRKSDAPWPQPPKELKTAIVQKKACRVLLLTPAHFTAGYRPRWLLERRSGVEPRLRAVAVQRPAVVSGWDFAYVRDNGRGAPKPTRRLAPAGAVYFLSLSGDDETAIAQWIDAMWMQCISDEIQDRWDGFGLAILGSWSGHLKAMKEA